MLLYWTIGLTVKYPLDGSWLLLSWPRQSSALLTVANDLLTLATYDLLSNPFAVFVLAAVAEADAADTPGMFRLFLFLGLIVSSVVCLILTVSRHHNDHFLDFFNSQVKHA